MESKWKWKYHSTKTLYSLLGGDWEDTLITDASKINDREQILFEIRRLLEAIMKENPDNIIGIGDSPAIFLQILHQFYPLLSIKYLPISQLSSVKDDETQKHIQGELKKLEVSENILWVDYVSGGGSLKTFIELLPEAIKKKSRFFVYGYFQTEIFKDVFKDVIYHTIDKNHIFYTFVASVIGYAENYDIRCIERREANKEFTLKLIENLEFLKCNQLAIWLFHKMKDINLFV